VRRRQLAQALRELREQAGIKVETVAERLDLSRSAIAAFESGRNLVSQPVLETLLRLYGAYEKFDVLNELRREAKKPGWWSTYRLPPWLKSYVGLESDAQVARAFSLELVPGLLQTEEYARQLSSMGKLSGDEIERRVAARLQRQQRLTDPDPLTFSAVISEGALRRLLAEPAAMAVAQLRHLASSARLSNVRLHVLPFTAGLHHSMSGSFTLLSFAPGVSLDIAYQEYAVGGHLVDEQDDVRELADVYDQLQGQALDEEASLAVISELRESMER
jgi:transcriptional regulator with XRE-family HTH domain